MAGSKFSLNALRALRLGAQGLGALGLGAARAVRAVEQASCAVAERGRQALVAAVVAVEARLRDGPGATQAPTSADTPDARSGGDEGLAASLAGFVWRHSRGDQMRLLAVTVATFPLLYASLELPKLIINDAISAETDAIALWGATFDRVEYLLLLCFGFLAAVLGGGLLKMRLNTMKGVVAERLLRRFRFQLVRRTLRFPLPYFQRTSQGELISMVSAEAEPLSGGMGDLVAQPVFQAGQMLTIVAFLFIQNVWLGLAATALIPLQAWLIPMLQRRINLLHKERVAEVRRFSARFGETIAGVEDLRSNNGARYALADFSARLGRLFKIRYEIYKRKFFLKFLNNFITQVTPFFFFSIGGYLVIQGQLSVGALVAALAAYKDLSAPWRELLTYVTQIQELSLRYRTIIDQFGPAGMLSEAGPDAADAPPRLDGPIELRNATVREPGGAAVLDRLSFTLPAGGMIAIESKSATERRVLSRLLSRAIAPNEGVVAIGGRDLADLDPSAVAARIGLVGSAPHLFNATIWENVGMALRVRPGTPADADRGALAEAARAGVSTDPIDAPWLDPSVAGLPDEEALKNWWLQIVEVAGSDDALFRRGLERPFDPERHPDLARRLVSLRDEARFRVRAAGLDRAVHWFDPERFNPGLAVAGNLLFAAPRRPLRAIQIAEDPRFAPTVRDMGLEPDMLSLGGDLLMLLTSAFGAVGPEHPLVQRAGLGPEVFARLRRIAERTQAIGADALCADDRALLTALPFQLTADQMGAAFPEALKDKVLRLRRSRGADLRAAAADIFAPIERDAYVEGLSALENVLFGKPARAAPAALEKLRALIGDLVIEAGLKSELAMLVGDEPAGVGGANLDPAARERIAFVRAVIKRPDVVVLDRPLGSQSLEERLAFRGRLRALLPEATLVFLEPEVVRPKDFDLVLEIEDGRLGGDAALEAANDDGRARDDGRGGEEGAARRAVAARNASASADLLRRRRAIESVEAFRDLQRPQLRLLAYASQWFEAAPGDAIFASGDPTDGAYVLARGEAELRWRDPDGAARTVSVIEPGRLIGDLSVILGTSRTLDMVARTRVSGVRIGAAELRDVIHGDAAVAVSLLRTTSENLLSVAERLRAYQARYPDPDARGVAGSGEHEGVAAALSAAAAPAH